MAGISLSVEGDKNPAVFPEGRSVDRDRDGMRAGAARTLASALTQRARAGDVWTTSTRTSSRTPFSDEELTRSSPASWRKDGDEVARPTRSRASSWTSPPPRSTSGLDQDGHAGGLPARRPPAADHAAPPGRGSSPHLTVADRDPQRAAANAEVEPGGALNAMTRPHQASEHQAADCGDASRREQVIARRHWDAEMAEPPKNQRMPSSCFSRNRDTAEGHPRQAEDRLDGPGRSERAPAVYGKSLQSPSRLRPQARRCAWTPPPCLSAGS